MVAPALRISGFPLGYCPLNLASDCVLLLLAKLGVIRTCFDSPPVEGRVLDRVRIVTDSDDFACGSN